MSKPPLAGKNIFGHIGSVSSQSTGDSKRPDGDFYCTPAEALDRLHVLEQPEKETIWEPACGTGAISEWLIGRDYNVVSTDLFDRGYGIPNVDFLQETEPRGKLL